MTYGLVGSGAKGFSRFKTLDSLGGGVESFLPQGLQAMHTLLASKFCGAWLCTRYVGVGSHDLCQFQIFLNECLPSKEILGSPNRCSLCRSPTRFEGWPCRRTSLNVTPAYSSHETEEDNILFLLVASFRLSGLSFQANSSCCPSRISLSGFTTRSAWLTLHGGDVSQKSISSPLIVYVGKLAYL